jgi:uncharacterized protein YeaO (DUF488 family)
MSEIITLVQIAAAAALVAAPAIALVRVLDTSGVADAAVAASAPIWPRGVQEQEPRPWQWTQTATVTGTAA